MRTVKIYFSPTGNTKRIVDAVASSTDLNGESTIDLDITLPDSRKNFNYHAQDGDVVIIGMPVYAGRIPNLLLPFIKTITPFSAGSSKVISCIPVVTYGGRNYDDALIELADILEDNGFNVLAAGAFIAEHSFSSKICNSLPDKDSLSFAARLGRLAIGKGSSEGKESVGFSIGVGNIKGMEGREGKVSGVFEEFRRNEIFVGKQNIKGREKEERVYYRPRFADGSPINMLKVKPKTKENCLRCGICAKRCPMGSISASDPTVITGPCIKCNRCVRECKVGAKYFDDAGYLFHVSDLERMVGNGYNLVK